MLGLTACGDGDDAATVTTIAIRPESYAVKPPATPPSTAPAVPVADAEGRSAAEQSYTIHEDEYPFEIAAAVRRRRSTSCATSTGGRPTTRTSRAPAASARIPPGAKFIDPAATTTSVAGRTTDEDDGDSTAEAGALRRHVPARGGRLPGRRRQKFDVTIEALLAANGFAMDGAGNVAAWPAVGTEIQLPAGPDCTATTPATTVAAG